MVIQFTDSKYILDLFLFFNIILWKIKLKIVKNKIKFTSILNYHYL